MKDENQKLSKELASSKDKGKTKDKNIRLLYNV